MRMLATLLALVALGGTAAAASLTQKQKNALGHIAQAQAAADICPKLETNDLVMAVIMQGFGLDFSDATVKSAFLEKYKEQIAPWKGVNPDAACIAGLLLYGPNGENVKGLVRLKQ
ncbi:hypothetical protein [Xanthobacter sp. 91]|uniref:hypothetical protein n=1 Tax=Xanthobacter sp. 91 TaxID=1117244 RepID=UPI000497AB1E|nr:hypothetical protein [Xanthobacter sp. 91]